MYENDPDFLKFLESVLEYHFEEDRLPKYTGTGFYGMSISDITQNIKVMGMSFILEESPYLDVEKDILLELDLDSIIDEETKLKWMLKYNLEFIKIKAIIIKELNDLKEAHDNRKFIIENLF